MRPDQAGVEPVPPADDLQPDAVADAARRLGAQVFPEQPHQRGHLERGPAPVVGREGVQGERADAEPRGRLDDPPHRLRAGPVSCGRGRPLPGGPAAVAVHDDADVEAGGACGEALCVIKS